MSTVPSAAADRTAGERFAAGLGIRVDRADPTLAGCGAVATFSPPPAAADPTDPTGSGVTTAVGDVPVPTGIVLALVDVTARAAAESAVAVPGRHTMLAPTATGVQYRAPARGAVTARASVPCEGVITDRADDHGVFRFSVAVDVVDPTGTRVASGSVQWLARITDAASAASTDGNGGNRGNGGNGGNDGNGGRD